jgi:hypothetical protein
MDDMPLRLPRPKTEPNNLMVPDGLLPIDTPRELSAGQLESVGGGGFGSAAAGVGATGAGAAQVDFFTQYYYFVYQPAPPLVCGGGICA